MIKVIAMFDHAQRRPVLATTILALLAAVAAEPLQAARMDDLLAMLAGADERQQALARQLLPRESIDAVPRLVELVAGEDERVWGAAFQVLADVVAEVGVPGRETERAVVAGHLMQLVAGDRPAVVRLRGLRLLPAAVPAGFDIGPVAAMLQEPELRERARVALAEMGTPEARAALRQALADADPAFQCALLDALGPLRDSSSIEAIRPLLSAQRVEVSLAALRALAWTADPELLQLGLGILARVGPEGKDEARDALLRVAQAVERAGGNWQVLVQFHLGQLAGGDEHLKEAALAALGRIGDGTCVEPMLAAVRGAEDPAWSIGMAALGSMAGVDVVEALVQAYPAQDARTQLALLDVLGKTRSPRAVPILTTAAQGSDPVVRLAAVRALAGCEQAEAIPLLMEAARSGSGEERSAGQMGLLRVADQLRRQGRSAEAGPVYAAVLKLAGSDDERRPALIGLAACPVAEALPAVMAAAEKVEIREVVGPALVAVAGAAAAGGQKEAALEAYQKARDLNVGPELMRAVAQGMMELGAEVDFASMLGVISTWWIVGPFDLGEDNAGWDKAYIQEPDVDLNARYMAGRRRLDWKRVTSGDERGFIDLLKVLGPAERAVAYAYTEIEVPREMSAVLRLGVDDSERIWVNGEKVFEHFVARGFAVDQDAVPVTLKAGRNTILLKIWQLNQGWEFAVRVTTPDHQPVPFVNRIGK